MRPDPFPSTTLLFYLWKRPDPREPGTAHPGLCFSPVTRQTDSLLSTAIPLWFVFSLARMNSRHSALTERAPTRGAPTVRIVLQQGRTCTGRLIRFRQQLLVSTSGSGLILGYFVQLPWRCIFLSMARRPF